MREGEVARPHRYGWAALVVLLTGLGLVSAGGASATVPGDNGKIAYVRDGDIWTMNPDGTSQTNLTNSPAAETDPAFSPDASRIAFARDGDIWVMNADGTNQENLTNDSAPDRDPDWSPDGLKLVFASDRERFDAELGHDVVYRGIYVMDADGSDATVLRETSIFAGSEEHWIDPTWSVDETIAFTSNDTDNPRIAVMSAGDGSGYTLIGPVGGSSPSWSPDATKIAFDGNTMDADGTDVTPFGDPFDEPRLRPSWSPDGAKIAYTKFGRVFVSDVDGLDEVDLMGPDCECTADQPDWGVAAAAPPPPGLPALSIDDVTVTEGDSGPVAATFTVSLSAASSDTVTVDYATADDSASSPDDYASASDTLSFSAGQTSETIDVQVEGDTLDEFDETFFAELSNPSNATIGGGQGEATILDDDPVVTISIDDVTVSEGDSGTVDAVFTVSLSAPSGKPVSVDFATVDGSAGAPADYEQQPLTELAFSPSETSHTIAVPVKGDILYENDETFFVGLQNPVNALLSDTQGAATILDDDDEPTLSIDDVTVSEGDFGTPYADFTVSLSAESGKNAAVDFNTVDLSAAAPDDYEANGGTVSFAPGETAKTLTVQVKGDTLDEPDETFAVDLSAPVNAGLADSRGIGTILDDDLQSDERAEADVPAGGTLTTDTEGDGATPDDPVEASITTPTGGPVTIEEHVHHDTRGFLAVLFLEAPPASAADPIVLTILFDDSLVPPPHVVEVYKNGVLVAPCSGPAGTASPDPCVSEMTRLPDGDLKVVILTSSLSEWAFELALDSDGDGVSDDADLCPGTPMSESVDADGCSDSQLGRGILFASTRTGNGDIYVTDPAGGAPTQLTGGSAIDAEPEWSPDGTEIAFTRRQGGNSDVYVMNADGSGVTRITTHPRDEVSPAWSPDETEIAFASNRHGGNWNIYVMNTDGSGVTRLTTHSAADTMPAWSPDGLEIAFSSARTGGGDVYSMNSDGTSPTRLTTSPGVDAEPDWFGSTIAFSTNRHGGSNFEVYSMNEDGTGQTRLTNSPRQDVSPAGSPEGTEIAFATNREAASDYEIYRMSAAGAGQAAVTADPALDVFPGW